jgi:DNA-binding beta-propeller fold protein YncE
MVAQTVLPFTGLAGPDGVAVDNAGNLYVTDAGNKGC